MSTIARRGFHYMQRLNSANVSPALLEKAQNRVIDAALTFIRERAKFKASPNIFLFLFVALLLDSMFVNL